MIITDTHNTNTCVHGYDRMFAHSIVNFLVLRLLESRVFILNANNEVPKMFDNKRREIGIRIPDNKIVLSIVEALGNPLATTSLHDDEDEIMDYFVDPYEIYERYDSKVELIIDGGYGNLEASTVVDCTGPDPEIAPKNIQAKTVAAEIPPVTGPAKLSARFTKRFDIPAASINAPANIKAGRAINGNEPTDVKAICTNLIGFSSRYKKVASAATPRDTVTGAPITSSSRKEPKRIITMLDSSTRHLRLFFS